MNQLKQFFYGLLQNVDYLAILALTFLSVGTAILGIYFLIARRNPVQERLTRILPARQTAGSTQKARLLEEEATGFTVKISRTLQEVIAPKEGTTRKKFRLRLIQAGLRSEKAFYNLVALKIILAIVLPGAWLITRFFFTFTLDVLLISLALALLGFFLPNIVLLHLVQSRQQKMLKALPDALDLMVVCVEAGLGLDMTFKRIGEEIRPMSKDLSDEFRLTNLEIRAGRSRDDSFKDMAVRTGIPEINNLMTILIQTGRFGTSMAKALRVHADAMRTKRRQLAEEKAAKSTVKLVFPLILFIFPALVIVLIGPAAIKIIQVLFPAISK
jgi:tight adherence protein C